MNFLASDSVLESAIAEFVGDAPVSDNAASPFLMMRNPLRKRCRTICSAIYRSEIPGGNFTGNSVRGYFSWPSLPGLPGRSRRNTSTYPRQAASTRKSQLFVRGLQPVRFLVKSLCSQSNEKGAAAFTATPLKYLARRTRRNRALLGGNAPLTPAHFSLNVRGRFADNNY